MFPLTTPLAALPEKVNLLPVKSVRLPQHYQFTVTPQAGWVPPRRDGYGLVIGDHYVGPIDGQEQPGSHGFNALLEKVLGYAAQLGKWAESAPCAVVCSNAAGNAFVARSNIQTLRLPARPLHDIAINQFDWAAIMADSPAPLALPPYSGRRLYRRAPLGGAPTALPKLWYVKPDNTLEDTAEGRGFDRLTFWQAAFGLSIRSTTKLKSEDVMAKLLNARVVPPVPAVGTLGAILAALPTYGDLGRCLMWTPSRFVCMLHPAPNCLFAMEFDAAGFHSEPAAAWLSKESPATVWNYRRLHHPTPPAAWGVTSLP